MTASYQPAVVLLSILIAIFVSYTALGIGGRIAIANRRALKYWVFGGSFSMGIGIWAMHFIGMLAFHLPIPLAYDPWITLASILPAIVSSAIALITLRFKDLSKAIFILAAVSMGIGITTMHYSGMAALRMQPAIEYDPLIFVLSVAIAIIASGAALILAFQHQTNQTHPKLRHLASATVMGLAIAGMHYTGMLAANFSPNSICLAAESGGFQARTLITLVTIFSIIVLIASLIATFVDNIRGENAFYKALLSAQSDVGEGVIIFEEHKPVFINEALTKLTGYSNSELMALPHFNEIFANTDQQRVESLIFDKGETKTLRAEAGLMTSDNLRRETELIVTSFFHADKIRKLVLLIDITDRKNAQRQLEEQKAESEKLARVAAQTDNAVIITNSKGRTEWVNAGFTRLTGYEELDIIGRKPGELLQGPESDQETVAFIREKLKNGEGFTTEIINYTKEGRKYWISINVQPITNDRGEVEQFIAIERDVTDWKNLVEELEKEKAQSEVLARVAAETDNAVIMLDVNDKIAWVNAAFETSTGYKAEEAFGKQPSDILVGKDTDQITLDEIQQHIQNHESFTLELLTYTKSRKKRWISLNAQPTRDENDEYNGYFLLESDITYQKNTQAELQALNKELIERAKERDLLAKIAETTDNAILILSADGITEWVNPGFTRITGYTLEDIIGKRPGDLLAGPETDPAKLQFIRGQYKEQKPFKIEHLNYTKAGKKIWVNIQSQPIFDKQGNIDRYFIIESDITYQKQSQQELEQLNQELKDRVAESELLAKVAATTDNSVVILDTDGNAMWINEGFVRESGYTREEILGKRPGLILAGPDTDKSQLDKFLQHYQNHESFVAESVNYTKDGKKYWVSLDAQPVFNDDGELEHYFILRSNITYQKEAQQKLEALNQSLEQRVIERTEEVEEQREFIETIFDTASSPILLLDREYKIVRYNKVCEDLTGLSLTTATDQPFWDILLSPSTLAEVKNNFPKGHLESVPHSIETTLYSKSGGIEPIVAWSNSVIRDDQGEVEYLIMTGVDITMRKLTENALKDANDELQETIATLRDTQTQLVQSEKMASLGGLVAGVAHEINTPIGIGVTSATNLDEEVEKLQQSFQDGTMKRSTLEEFINHAKQASTILQKNLRRASELISSFKQVAVDQSSDAWRTVDIHEYVDEIITSLRPKWRNTPIQLINDCDTDLAGFSHPGAIYQVLSNFINNSLLHGFEEGQPGEIRISAHQKDDQLEIIYHDNGKGIPEEYQKKVFDPFFTTRRGTGGSGLGLHIVFNLIHSTLKGQVTLNSDESNGTTFVITFPFQKEERAA